MSIRREIHPTRQRIAKMLQELGPMTKYQIACECFVAFRNVNEYLNLMHKDLEVYIHSWIRSGKKGGPWTKVWGYGAEKNAKRPKPTTPAERSRKRREDPEVQIQELLAKRVKRHNERMRKLLNEDTRQSNTAVS